MMCPIIEELKELHSYFREKSHSDMALSFNEYLFLSKKIRLLAVRTPEAQIKVAQAPPTAPQLDSFANFTCAAKTALKILEEVKRDLSFSTKKRRLIPTPTFSCPTISIEDENSNHEYEISRETYHKHEIGKSHLRSLKSGENRNSSQFRSQVGEQNRRPWWSTIWSIYDNLYSSSKKVTKKLRPVMASTIYASLAATNHNVPSTSMQIPIPSIDPFLKESRLAESTKDLPRIPKVSFILPEETTSIPKTDLSTKNLERITENVEVKPILKEQTQVQDGGSLLMGPTKLKPFSFLLPSPHVASSFTSSESTPAGVLTQLPSESSVVAGPTTAPSSSLFPPQTENSCKILVPSLSPSFPMPSTNGSLGVTSKEPSTSSELDLVSTPKPPTIESDIFKNRSTSTQDKTTESTPIFPPSTQEPKVFSFGNIPKSGLFGSLEAPKSSSLFTVPSNDSNIHTGTGVDPNVEPTSVFSLEPKPNASIASFSSPLTQPFSQLNSTTLPFASSHPVTGNQSTSLFQFGTAASGSSGETTGSIFNFGTSPSAGNTFTFIKPTSQEEITSPASPSSAPQNRFMIPAHRLKRRR